MVVYPYKTNQVSLPGNCNVAYIDEGRGEQTLLFIHGLANYAMVWQKNIASLKQHYRCIALDLPGNGLSDKNEHAFGIKFFAECVYEFIKVLKLNNVCVVGHSMGGQVAMRLLIDRPECAERLILCAPAGFEEFSALDKTIFYAGYHVFDFMASEENMLRQTIEHSFYHQHKQAEGVVKELVEIMRSYGVGYYRKMLDGCVKGMLEEPVLHEVHRIKQRTLILFGLHDALIPNKLLHHGTPEKLAKEAVGKMQHAVLGLLPNCGHFVQWEKADEVNKAIADFLEN